MNLWKLRFSVEYKCRRVTVQCFCEKNSLCKTAVKAGGLVKVHSFESYTGEKIKLTVCNFAVTC